MWEEILHTIPGPGQVEADFGAFAILTDHPPKDDRAGRAPEPWMLFLASIGTCAASYVAARLGELGLPADGVRVVQRQDFTDEETARLAIELTVELPAGFPENAREEVLEAARACLVSRAIQAAPELRFAVRSGPEREERP